jgi:hypothetical protein
VFGARACLVGLECEVSSLNGVLFFFVFFSFFSVNSSQFSSFASSVLDLKNEKQQT